MYYFIIIVVVNLCLKDVWSHSGSPFLEDAEAGGSLKGSGEWQTAEQSANIFVIYPHQRETVEQIPQWLSSPRQRESSLLCLGNPL